MIQKFLRTTSEVQQHILLYKNGRTRLPLVIGARREFSESGEFPVCVAGEDY